MRTLKLRIDLPWHLESKLCQKYGYHVQRRQLGEFILFGQSPIIASNVLADGEKKQPLSLHEIVQANKQKKDSKVGWVGPQQLTLADIDELTKRMLTIINSFADPTKHIGPVRARLYSMSQTCHNTAERIFVMQWMDEKFPSPIKGLIVSHANKEPSVLTGEMPPPDKPGKVWDTLPPPEVCKELEGRCDRIINFFADPFNNIGPVRTRLYNMARTLKTAPERQYVQDYMDDNFPIEAE